MPEPTPKNQGLVDKKSFLTAKIKSIESGEKSFSDATDKAQASANAKMQLRQVNKALGEKEDK